MASRRSFLKVGGLTAAALALGGRAAGAANALGDFPTGPEVVLGRVAWPWGVTVLTRPRPEGAVVRTVYPDELVLIRREVVGRGIMPHNHVWFELDDGFIYTSHVVPCYNWPQTALTSLPPGGLWGEVTVPYVEGRAAPDPKAAVKYRMYSHAVYRLFEIMKGVDGQVWVRAGTEVTPFMYAPATAFRVVHPSEVTPISPEVSDKVMVIDLSRQMLTAVEGKAEVFRTRIASGAQFFGEDGQTLQGGSTVGVKHIWQKRYSRQMQGGTRESGWDIPGVPWVAYYAGNGEALHAAYWHNDFGRAKSRGCINLKPADALWLFRWTLPVVAYHPGDITVNMSNPGSVVDIRLRT